MNALPPQQLWDLPGIRGHRYGTIEAANGELREIRFRLLPKWISYSEVWWDQVMAHRRPQDRCLLYFDQPWGSPDYLALKYVVSEVGTRLQTIRIALSALDEVARIKSTDAIVCEVSNDRISDRVLRRLGWESHLPHSKRRHFIRRFYGSYPPSSISLGASATEQSQ